MKQESTIISSTGPNTEGEMLWCVHFKSSDFEGDPFTLFFYVLAKKKDEAITKAGPSIVLARQSSGKKATEKIEATVVALENLVPTRDKSLDGAVGIYGQDFARVELVHPDDTKRYRLGVCLIPEE